MIIICFLFNTLRACSPEHLYKKAMSEEWPLINHELFINYYYCCCYFNYELNEFYEFIYAVLRMVIRLISEIRSFKIYHCIVSLSADECNVIARKEKRVSALAGLRSL